MPTNYNAIERSKSIDEMLKDGQKVTLDNMIDACQEKDKRVKGLEYITPIQEAIINRAVLKIKYESFHSSEPVVHYISPETLEEFRNRWFLLGRRMILTRDITTHHIPFSLALDRILEIEVSDKKYEGDPCFNPEVYIRDIVGTTNNYGSKRETIRFMVDADQTPYVRTHPFHVSQREVKEAEDGSVIFEIDAILNQELMHDFLGYGEHLTVLSPSSLVATIKSSLVRCIGNYLYEFSEL